MSQEGIINIEDGAFFDITVPVEFAEVLKERIPNSHGYSIDKGNCFKDQSGYHIRIILTTSFRAQCLQHIRDIGHELGLVFVKPKEDKN